MKATTRRRSRVRPRPSVAFAAALLAGAPAAAAPRSALWRMVHDVCAVDARLTGSPAPCLRVDRARGFALVRDLRRQGHVLLVPTRRIAGIEGAALQNPDAPPYWLYAWEARATLASRGEPPPPRQAVALAVNSRYGRSQDQLHIHIGCVRPSVRALLDARAGSLGVAWSDLEVDGVPYRVRRIAGDAPGGGGQDPFKLLAASDPSLAPQMARWTLALVGATLADGRAGFYLLANRADRTEGEQGHGEGLLDKRCTLLAPGAALGR